MHALVLNASYEPHQVVSVREAFALIMRGKAEAVPGVDVRAVYRSEKMDVEVPAVVRLINQVKIPYRATVPLNRATLIARDNRTCQYCFKAGDTIDHVIPRSRGGQHVWSNVVCACTRCNSYKGDKSLAEIGWKLYNKPYAPKAWFYVVFRFQPDPAWAKWLEPQVA